MKDVFISYKAEEIEEASWVKSELESNGISCWMAPACIPGGSSYAVEIPKAIRESKVFVLILSSKAQSSKWISREVDTAINEGKIILPFMLDNCALRDDFSFYLRHIQYYAAYENKLAAVKRMTEEIKGLIDGEKYETHDEVKQEEKPKKTNKEPAHKNTSKQKYEIKSALSLIFGIVGIGSYVICVMIATGFRTIVTDVVAFILLILTIVSSVTAIVLSILSLKPRVEISEHK